MGCDAKCYKKVTYAQINQVWDISICTPAVLLVDARQDFWTFLGQVLDPREARGGLGSVFGPFLDI